MLRLNAELAIFLAIAAVVLQGGVWATVAMLFLFIVVFPAVLGRWFYGEFMALRDRLSLLQEERQRFAREMRIVREAKPTPDKSYPPDEEPQSGGS